MIMMTIECRYRWSVPDLPDALNLDHPVLHWTVDGYLEAWSDASIDELRRTMTDALRVASLRRAHAWLTNLAEADREALAQHGQPPCSGSGTSPFR
ncbi:hypothetical protein [Microlunatus sp. GCM10028923]|uniref:hypothetical protein n=1 Tax=Microlunatus sp. GCM10028923 TaxID=3273400 RepID=UPI003616DB36